MSDTTSTTDAGLGEVTFTRIYDAPASVLFECLTTPEHLTHFWGPVGTSTPLDKITVDLRVGGVFETIMVNDSDGAEYPSRGIYVEIDPPNRLVFSEPDVAGGMTTAITFNELGDGRTEVVTHQTNVPEMFRSPEAEAGMLSSFDRFAAYVATL